MKVDSISRIVDDAGGPISRAGTTSANTTSRTVSTTQMPTTGRIGGRVQARHQGSGAAPPPAVRRAGRGGSSHSPFRGRPAHALAVTVRVPDMYDCWDMGPPNLA